MGARVGDDAMWILHGEDSICCATSQLELRIVRRDACDPQHCSSGDVTKSPDDAYVSLQGSDGVSLPRDSKMPGSFSICRGPAKLPSEHLVELVEKGYTVIERILEPGVIAHLKQVFALRRCDRHSSEPATDGNFWMQFMLPQTPAIARAISHPVALWVLTHYLGTEAIHYGHQPIVQTLKPAKALLGAHPEGGWHSDFPYHQGYASCNFEKRLGVQFNICVDDFRRDNGATQFLPGSHLAGHGPDESWNRGGTRLGQGLHKDVEQMLAQAGAAILYDSRTWHRACPELNASGCDRIALLNAVNVQGVSPMMPMWNEAQKFLQSEALQLLTRREQADIGKMCIDIAIPEDASGQDARAVQPSAS